MKRETMVNVLKQSREEAQPVSPIVATFKGKSCLSDISRPKRKPSREDRPPDHKHTTPQCI